MTSPLNSLVAKQPYVKVFADRCDLEIRAFINIFHAWVKDRRTEDLLIDVHDYSHVHQGPGVVLVAHEAHYGMDRRDGRLGLVCRLRRGDLEPLGDGLARAARSALMACQLLEHDAAGKLTFDTSALLVGFEDRLNAANEPATFASFRPELVRFAARLLGDDSTAERVGGDRDVFGARIAGPAANGAARTLAEMLKALS